MTWAGGTLHIHTPFECISILHLKKTRQPVHINTRLHHPLPKERTIFPPNLHYSCSFKQRNDMNNGDHQIFSP